MIVRSKAPLRISFAGGGTDVPPYPQEKGGAVLNCTINKYAYASLEPTDEQSTEIESLDFDMVAKYNLDEDLRYNGELDLVKSVIKNMGGTKGHRLFIHCDAPPGSGLGSSSTMTVAMIGAFQRWLNRPMTDYDIAEKAYFIEREDLKISGGYQDQYASTFGGFNFMEFMGDRVIINPLKVKRDVLQELEYNLLLCYTGGTRLSANIIDDQTDGFVKKNVDVVHALDTTKQLAIQLKDALMHSDLSTFGDILHQGWDVKKKFSAKITNPVIDKLYETARNHGALGGKLLGAGGGGYLLLYCDFGKKYEVTKVLTKAGGQIVDFSFEPKGLQTWVV